MAIPTPENTKDIIVAAGVLPIVEGRSIDTNEFQMDIEWDAFGKKSRILHYHDSVFFRIHVIHTSILKYYTFLISEVLFK